MEMLTVREMELAEYLGLSDRRVRDLVKLGVLDKNKDKTYNLKQNILAYINYVRGGEGKDETLEKLNIARAAETLSHEQLKKRKTELQVLSLEKKMHAQEDVEYYWNTMVLAAKSRLTAIPVKCAPVLVGIEDRKEVQSILKREISDALNEISEYDINQFDKDPEESDDDEI